MIYTNVLFFLFLLSQVSFSLSASSYEHEGSIYCHFFLPIQSSDSQELPTLLIFSTTSPFAPGDPNEGIIDGGILSNGQIVLTTPTGRITILELNTDFNFDINFDKTIEHPITSLALLEKPNRAFLTTNFINYILPLHSRLSYLYTKEIKEIIITAPGLTRVIPEENLLLAQTKNGSYLLVGEIDTTTKHIHRKKSKIKDATTSKNGCIYTFGEDDAVLMRKQDELNVLVIKDTPLCFVEGKTFKRCAYVFTNNGNIQRVALLTRLNEKIQRNEPPLDYKNENRWDNYVSIRLLGKTAPKHPKLDIYAQEMKDIFNDLLMDLEYDPDYLMPSQILASTIFPHTHTFNYFSEHHDPHKIRRVMFFDPWILFWEGPKLSIWKKKNCDKKYNVLDGYEVLDRLKKIKNTVNKNCIIS